MGRSFERVRLRVQDAQHRGGTLGVVRMLGSYAAWRFRRRPFSLETPSVADWHRAYGILDPGEPPTPPAISVVTPVYNTSKTLLRGCAESVRAQTYTRWEHILVDDASSEAATLTQLHRLAHHPRTRLLRNPHNLGIAATTNRGIEEARGEFVVFLDHDDTLAPTALAWIADAASRGADLIYSDEDKLLEDGSLDEPFHKPAWSPRLLYALNYVNHLLSVRTSTLRDVGGLREGFEGAQDHDLLLRLADLPMTVSHLPNLLYHWRKTTGSTASVAANKVEAEQAGLRAVSDAVSRRGLQAEATLGRGSPFRYRVVFRAEDAPPTVKVVIPTRDRVKLLSRVVTGLFDRTDAIDLHVVIVDNGSERPSTLSYLRRLQDEKPDAVTVTRIDDAFNYSLLCNAGAAAGPQKDLVLFLNNDVEIMHRRWLLQLSGWLRDEEVVGVGTKLLFPDRTIQHAGVVVGLGGVAGHYALRLPDEPMGGNLHDQAREIGCLTAACLLLRTSDLWKVDGFDEQLATDFQDVDLCLRLRHDLDGVLMYDPTYPLLHVESASRGLVGASSRYTLERMKFRWSGVLDAGDPYYNPHLTLEDHNLAPAVIPADQRGRIRRLAPRMVPNRAPTGAG